MDSSRFAEGPQVDAGRHPRRCPPLGGGHRHRERAQVCTVPPGHARPVEKRQSRPTCRIRPVRTTKPDLRYFCGSTRGAWRPTLLRSSKGRSLDQPQPNDSRTTAERQPNESTRPDDETLPTRYETTRSIQSDKGGARGVSEMHGHCELRRGDSRIVCCPGCGEIGDEVRASYLVFSEPESPAFVRWLETVSRNRQHGGRGLCRASHKPRYVQLRIMCSSGGGLRSSRRFSRHEVHIITVSPRRRGAGRWHGIVVELALALRLDVARPPSVRDPLRGIGGSWTDPRVRARGR